MLCEVRSVFFFPADIGFEDISKGWLHTSGRIRLRKDIIMKVESTSYYDSLDALELWKEKMQQKEQLEKSSETQDTCKMSSDISSLPIPSCNYNSMGMMNSGYEALLEKE